MKFQTWQAFKKKVAIIGGTHGNEPTGYYLVRYLNEHARHLLQRNYECVALIGNPKAVQHNVRYYDSDLNRCFLMNDLHSNKNLHLYEPLRAKYLNRTLGRKGESKATDVIFDLHNTTAFTGVLLLLHPKDIFAHQIAEYIQAHHSSPVRISQWEDGDQPYLPTIAKSGMTVEVGPVPQGCLNSKVFEETKTVIEIALDFIEKHNQKLIEQPELASRTDNPTSTVDVFRRIGTIDFPRNDDGELLGMVHSNFQDKDFVPLKDQDELLFNFDGTITRWDQSKHNHEVYPYFINEAAYYEKQIAFALAEKVTVSYPSSFVKE